MSPGIPQLEEIGLGQIGLSLLVLLVVRDYAQRHVWPRFSPEEGAPGENRQAESPKEGSLAKKADGAGD